MLDLLKLKGGAAIDSLLLAFVKVVTTMAGIVCTMVLSRTLTLAEYGTYSQGNLVISLITSMTVLGLTDASNYFFNRPEYGRRYITNVLFLEVMVGVAAGVLVIIFGNQIALYFGNEAVAPLAAFLAFRPLTGNLLGTLQVLIVSLGKSKMLAARNLSVSVVKVAVVCVVGFVYKSLALIFCAYLVVDVVNVVWFIATYIRQVGRPELVDLDLRALKTILFFSIPMAVSVLVSTYSREMAKIVLGALATTEEYAVFANCSAQLPLDFVSASFMTVLMPIFTRYVGKGDLDSARSVYTKFLQTGYYLVWPFAVCLALLSPECVSILYGDNYVSGWPIFTMYLVTYATTFFSSTIVLTASGKTRIIMMIAVASLAGNAVLCLGFSLMFGIFGAAAASICVNFVTALVMLKKSCECLKGGLRYTADFSSMTKTLLLLIGLTAPAFLLKVCLGVLGLHEVPLAAIVAVAYLGCFYLVERNNVVALLRSINRMK